LVYDDLVAIGKRLREARLNAGLSQTTVAKRLNYSKQLVSHWETGRSGVAVPDLERLGRLYSADIRYLVTGLITPSGQGAMALHLQGGLPVAKITQEELLEIARGNLKPLDIEEKRIVYAKCSENSLMLEVPDHAMIPGWPIGTQIVVDRELMPHTGDCVCIVLVASGEVLFRRYRPSSSGKSVTPPYTLRADNKDDYLDRFVTKSDKPVFMGTLVETVRRGSR
jgi:transcriptional regulator with XRE-family HTH domain